MKELHELRQDLACLEAAKAEAFEFEEYAKYNRLCDDCLNVAAEIQAQLNQEIIRHGRETEQEARPRVAITGILWGRGGRDAARADNHARCSARDTGKWESLFGTFAALRCDNSRALGE